MKELEKCETEPQRIGGIFIRYVSIAPNTPPSSIKKYLYTCIYQFLLKYNIMNIILTQISVCTLSGEAVIHVCQVL